jgi:DNA mismatch endonuclease, patch repair protein
VSPHPLWKDSRPPDAVWKPPRGLSRAQRIIEQDTAAGGRAAREVRLSEGRRAHASIALRIQPKGRRIYAYLRWSDGGKTDERYVGEVDRDSRATNLEQAWHTVHEAGLLGGEPNS